jgi:hypothetical protein
VYSTEGLAVPNPFLFLERAFTLKVLPLAIPLIVQEVFKFTIKQDLPSAVILLPVILEPPFSLGTLIFTVTLKNPFLALEDFMETIIGADGLLMLACA